MLKATFVQHNGESVKLDVETGYTLMEAAVRGGVEGIDAECGGACACGTCHIIVDEAWFSKLAATGEDEAAMLEFVSHASPTSRLACQVRLNEDLDGIVIKIPPSQG